LFVVSANAELVPESLFQTFCRSFDPTAFTGTFVTVHISSFETSDKGCLSCLF